MARSFRYCLILVLSIFCSVSIAQSYEYGQRQGYIFSQAYVQRISLQHAERIMGSPGLFGQLLSLNWRKEVIKDRRVKRVGDRLILQFDARPPLSLRDFVRQETMQSEGDAQTYTYIQSARDYHVVGVEFGHDQPAFLLVAYSGSTIYFVDTN